MPECVLFARIYFQGLPLNKKREKREKKDCPRKNHWRVEKADLKTRRRNTLQASQGDHHFQKSRGRSYEDSECAGNAAYTCRPRLRQLRILRFFKPDVNSIAAESS
jgi:hypothetical protein